MIRYKAVMVNKESDFTGKSLEKKSGKFAGSEIMERDEYDFRSYEEAHQRALFLNKTQPVVIHDGVAGVWQAYYERV